METLKVINVINFIRGCEPRLEMDLLTPVKKQIELIAKTGLKCTFLFQYDALLREDMTSLFSNIDGERIEIGGWFEMVRQQTEKACIKWRGRPDFDWDHYADVDTPMGYSLEERIKLVDEFMAEFKRVFGYYPKSMGAWAIDAFTLNYMYEKYGIQAFCICREQVGTDGYSFSGGYYSGGYYASKNNALCPAQSLNMQIDVPVFRMLGSDVVKQYYMGLDENYNPAALQGVATLEPVGNGKIGGSNPAWVDWFLKSNYEVALNFAYAQAGQENSFGWERMKDGLNYQFKKMAADVKCGKYTDMTLSECGLAFKKRFPLTPATTSSAFGSFENDKEGTVWYESKNYRISYYYSNEKFLIRDIYLFDERYKERYLDSVLKSIDYVYDNLPLIDGYLYSGNKILAGLYLTKNGKEIDITNLKYSEPEKNTAAVTVESRVGRFEFLNVENGITVRSDDEFYLELKAAVYPPLESVSGKTLKLKHNGYEYVVSAKSGEFIANGKTFKIKSENGVIALDLQLNK